MGNHVRNSGTRRIVLAAVACAALSAGPGALAEEASPVEPDTGPLQAEEETLVEPTEPTERISESARNSDASDVVEPGQATGGLDLSLPPEVVEPVEPSDDGSLTEVGGSPALFNDKPEEASPVRLKGRLLKDKNEKSSLDAVDGAQLIIEVQTE